MARAFFLLTLLSYWSGTTSQSPLTQPPSQAVGLGQVAKLSCTRSGERPRYIQCAGYGRADSVPDRFTASDSGNVGTLTITNAQPEDEADYYCIMWYSPSSQFHRDET
uniref:Uncharacterized protein n=1 Tax=Sphaerodactylus townsendi TaxID=933632 RepID=A0ACB8FY79_9SAUR